jgi:hypothetical protein
MVEEHSEACFTRGSRKRRRTLLSVKLRGDKDERRTWTSVGQQHQREVVGGGRATVASPCMRGRALAGTRGYSRWVANKWALDCLLYN